MAALVQLNHVILVTVVGRYCGQTTMNTYPYKVTVAPATPLTQAAFFPDFDAELKSPGALITTQRSCSPENWENVENWYQVIRNVRFSKYVIPSTLPGTFTTNDGLTANLQAAVERYGELSGRQYVGGVRVPIGTDDSCFDDGELTPALKTQLEAHAIQMIQPIVLSGYTLLPLIGLNANSADEAFATRTHVNPYVRVIRRRTVGLGI